MKISRETQIEILGTLLRQKIMCEVEIKERVIEIKTNEIQATQIDYFHILKLIDHTL